MYVILPPTPPRPPRRFIAIGAAAAGHSTPLLDTAPALAASVGCAVPLKLRVTPLVDPIFSANLLRSMSFTMCSHPRYFDRGVGSWSLIFVLSSAQPFLGNSGGPAILVPSIWMERIIRNFLWMRQCLQLGTCPTPSSSTDLQQCCYESTSDSGCP